MTAPAVAPGRLPGLESLRGIAALLLLVFHLRYFPTVAAVAWLAFRFIEQPGIHLGERLAQRAVKPASICQLAGELLSLPLMANADAEIGVVQAGPLGQVQRWLPSLQVCVADKPFQLLAAASDVDYLGCAHHPFYAAIYY